MASDGSQHWPRAPMGVRGAPAVKIRTGADQRQHRGMCNVPVIGVVEAVVVLAIPWGVDFRSGEGMLHLLEQAASAFTVVVPAAPGVDAGQDVFEFDENPGAPHGGVRVLHCKLKEEVALAPL